MITPAKTCTGCGEIKPLPCFLPNHRAPDGRLNRCTDCVKAAAEAARRPSKTLTTEQRP